MILRTEIRSGWNGRVTLEVLKYLRRSGACCKCWVSLSPIRNEDHGWLSYPQLNEVEGGHTGFTLSIGLSVRLSVCGQNRVRSVSSIILAGSISYLHILSSNFRRCVANSKIQKFEFLSNSLNL